MRSAVTGCILTICANETGQSKETFWFLPTCFGGHCRADLVKIVCVMGLVKNDSRNFCFSTLRAFSGFLAIKLSVLLIIRSLTFRNWAHSCSHDRVSKKWGLHQIITLILLLSLSSKLCLKCFNFFIFLSKFQIEALILPLKLVPRFLYFGFFVIKFGFYFALQILFIISDSSL